LAPSFREDLLADAPLLDADRTARLAAFDRLLTA
jgi:hypothetical protein